MPLLCSHPARRDYTPVLTQTVISFFAVSEMEKGLSTLSSIPGNKRRQHEIITLNDVMLRPDSNIIYG